MSAPRAFQNKPHAVSDSREPRAAAPRCRTENNRPDSLGLHRPSGTHADKPLRTSPSATRARRKCCRRPGPGGRPSKLSGLRRLPSNPPPTLTELGLSKRVPASTRAHPDFPRKSAEGYAQDQFAPLLSLSDCRSLPLTGRDGALPAMPVLLVKPERGGALETALGPLGGLPGPISEPREKIPPPGLRRLILLEALSGLSPSRRLPEELGPSESGPSPASVLTMSLMP